MIAANLPFHFTYYYHIIMYYVYKVSTINRLTPVRLFCVYNNYALVAASATEEDWEEGVRSGLSTFSKSNKTEEKRKPYCQRWWRRRPLCTASGRCRSYYDPARMWGCGAPKRTMRETEFLFAIQWTTRRTVVRWSHVYLCRVKRYFDFRFVSLVRRPNTTRNEVGNRRLDCSLCEPRIHSARHDQNR